jgi:quercetin dioxygenase-like cupin family protein
MRKSLVAFAALAAAVWVLRINASAQHSHGGAAPVMLGPGDIKWGPCPPALPAGGQCAILEGNPAEAGPFVVRTRMPAGYRIPPHWHPSDEHVTVISGTVGMGTGEKVDKSMGHAMAAGSYMVMPKETRHWVWTDAPAEIQVSGMGPFVMNYIDPKDDPRNGKPAGTK